MAMETSDMLRLGLLLSRCWSSAEGLENLHVTTPAKASAPCNYDLGALDALSQARSPFCESLVPLVGASTRAAC
eukprot:644871-Amphidinium_carterae.1